MKRRKRISRLAFALLAGGAALAVAALPSCDESNRPGPFVVEGATAGAGPLYRNEPLVLRFSEPLEEGHPPQFAAIVRTARGQSLAVAARADGRHLLLEPHRSQTETDRGLSPLWPIGPYLEVSVPLATAGRELKSRSGSLLARPFHARIPLSPDLLRLPGQLEVLETAPRDLLTSRVEVSMDDPEFEVRIRFNTSIDPASLEAGVQVIDRSRQDRVHGARPQLLPGDARQVRIRPFLSGFQLFNAGTQYEILLTGSLRSRDGRSLAEPKSLKFRTARGGPRLLQIGFDQASDFAPESSRCWNPAWPNLRPLKEEFLVASNASGEQRTLLELVAGPEDSGAEAVPAPFSSRPSHAQILIPGRWFPNHEPAVVTGIGFLGSPIGPACTAELVISMGLLEESRALAGLGLSPRYDANINYATVRHIPLPSRDGRFQFPASPGAEPAQAGRSTAAWRPFEISFESPFDYPGRGQDILLDIRNLTGVRNPVNRNGIDLLGTVQRGGADTILLGELGASSGFKGPVNLALVLRAQRYYDVLTRWYVVEDAEEPAFRDAGWKGEGIRDHHFRVLWQSGTPVLRPDGAILTGETGTPVCEPEDPDGWSVFPPTSGARAIRARISYNPSAVYRAERPPEIEYLLLAYREGRTR